MAVPFRGDLYLGRLTAKYCAGVHPSREAGDAVPRTPWDIYNQMKETDVRVFLGPLTFGLVGFAILVSLGIWQVQRLTWKQGILAEIEARIAGPVQDLPKSPLPERDRFLPVSVVGGFDGSDVPVFLSHAGGPIYRLVAAFETASGRRIMVDRGGISALNPLVDSRRTSPKSDVQITGNLHWPDEVDAWTPERDATGTFFGRDIAAMAAVLQTEPVLIVAREMSENAPPTRLLPVTTTGIPNNHFGYAVQWFGLAIVWAGMTLFFVWRIRSGSSKDHA